MYRADFVRFSELAAQEMKPNLKKEFRQAAKKALSLYERTMNDIKDLKREFEREAV